MLFLLKRLGAMRRLMPQFCHVLEPLESLIFLLLQPVGLSGHTARAMLHEAVSSPLPEAPLRWALDYGLIEDRLQ